MSDSPLQFESRDLAHTLAIGRALASCAEAGDLIGLVGELGAGKTQLVRGMAEGLGIDPRQVSSPTFVLVQEYEPSEAHRPVLVHIDAYRLGSDAELETIGWGEHGEELRRGAVVAVEWADLVQQAMGEDWLEVHLHHAGPKRWLELSAHGAWRDRMELVGQCLQETTADLESEHE